MKAEREGTVGLRDPSSSSYLSKGKIDWDHGGGECRGDCWSRKRQDLEIEANLADGETVVTPLVPGESYKGTKVDSTVFDVVGREEASSTFSCSLDFLPFTSLTLIVNMMTQ